MNTVPRRDVWPLPSGSDDPFANLLKPLSRREEDAAERIEALARSHHLGLLAIRELGLMRRFMAGVARSAGGELRLSAEAWAEATERPGNLVVEVDAAGNVRILAEDLQIQKRPHTAGGAA